MSIQQFSTPGVYRKEIDKSDILSPVGNSTGAIVGRFKSGPINKPILVSSTKELIEIFGTPIFTSGATLSPVQQDVPNLGYGFYSADQFLKESNALYVSRIVDSGDKYAGVYIQSTGYDYTSSASTTNTTSGFGISTIPYVNGNQFDTLDNISSIETNANIGSVLTTSGASTMLISSVFPGTEANNIAVSIETFSSACSFVYQFDGFPLSGNISAGSQVIAEQVVRLDVYVKNSSQSWDSIKYDIATKQSSSQTSAMDLKQLFAPTESYFGTLSSMVDGNGNQLLLSKLVNGISKYIYIKIGAGASFGKFGSGLSQTNTSPAFMKAYNLIPLAGGTFSIKSGLGDESNSELSSILSTWDIFGSREMIPSINIFICSDWNSGVKQKVAQIVANRMDAIAVLQTGNPSDNTVALIKSRETYGYASPSYCACYCGFHKIYDQYNDKYFYLPKSSFASSIYARVSRISNVWDATAGINRAIISSYGDKFILTDAQIGQLYDFNINSSKNIIGTGAVIWGQKTAQLKKSALDRVNVRRDLLYIENSIEPLLQQFLFEINNDRTRQRITSLIDNFLSDILASGGLEAYSVVCDATNNTASVIDANQLVVDIYVKPPKVIEFIQLNTIILSTGVSITEIV